MRLPALMAASAFALAACGQDALKTPTTQADAPAPVPAPTAAAAPPAGSPLGSGQAMRGSVSPLRGRITAFQVQETTHYIVVDLAADVLFAFDSADLSGQAPEQLRKTVEQIRRGGPSSEIQVIGHTDSHGDDAYNNDLSLRRARAVVAWLSGEGGVPAARLKPEGRGERDPVAPNAGTEGNDYPEGRAMNRRVQVIIPKA
jgi:outer membrane protein OmpA-like peptidoglycan-associated protein